MFDSRGKQHMKKNSKSPSNQSVLHELKLSEMLENEKESLSKTLLSATENIQTLENKVKLLNSKLKNQKI